MTTTPHPFAVGDKIRFSKPRDEFNRRFLSRFIEDSDGVVTVTDVVSEPDGYSEGSVTHYVRLAEDGEPVDPEVSNLGPIWNVSWFHDKPVTPAPTTAQEATVTNTREFKVGDKVRITAARTQIGGPLPHEKGTYIGATATIVESLFESPDEREASWTLEFDDKSLSNFGSWSSAALDLVEEAPSGRPTIDFSGSSRSTAREYARDANTRLLSSSHQALLRSVGKGEEVDAYALNEALLAAMRATLTRHGASTQRRVTGRKIAYLGHITQAVLENHAQGLPAYEQGERSRLLAEVKPALAAAQQEVEAQTERANQFRTRLERSEGERAQFLQAASDERRRLCGEIDDLKAEAAEYRRTADDEVSRLLAVARERDGLLAETVTDRDNVALVLDYAMGLLTPTQRQRVLGYWDGVDRSRVERASE